MASFSDQFTAAQRSNLAVRALESAARIRISEIFAAWERGDLTDQSVRWELERVVRSAYRSSAAMGLSTIAAQAGIPRWKPWRLRTESLRSSYLDGLLEDVRRNLRTYKASARESEDRTRAISRIEHSAGVSSARGYTDASIQAARELSEDYGFIVRKVWTANFVNHVPCPLCADLHGTEVGLGEGFPGDNRLSVYGNLLGPPRHPRCMCWVVILVVDLSNYSEEPSGESTAPGSDTMSSDDVKQMDDSTFGKIVRWLRTLVRRLRNDSVE